MPERRITPEDRFVDGAGWPRSNPVCVAGELAHLGVIRHRLSAVTDVGSLETILRDVVAHCRALRVRPDVFEDVFSSTASEAAVPSVTENGRGAYG